MKKEEEQRPVFIGLMLGIVSSMDNEPYVGVVLTNSMGAHSIVIDPNHALAIYEQLTVILDNLGMLPEEEDEPIPGSTPIKGMTCH
jgi:hypothetical protein